MLKFKDFVSNKFANFVSSKTDTINFKDGSSRKLSADTIKQIMKYLQQSNKTFSSPQDLWDNIEKDTGIMSKTPTLQKIKTELLKK